MSITYILLGANLGDRIAQMSKALNELCLKAGTLIRCSSLYETQAWGKEDAPLYVNQVICMDTAFDPQSLLKLIHEIEGKLGRTREVKWGSRLIDIDILFYGDAVINDPNLIIPHPYLDQRKFTLVPLVEIAGDLIHPVLHKSMQELLDNLDDPLAVNKLQSDTN